MSYKKALINKEEELQNIELVSLVVLNADNEQAIGFTNKWGELGIFLFNFFLCNTIVLLPNPPNY